ncbi:MAG: flagellar export chaperone FliS [Pseudomonadota bacterium]|jgi:flagellar protein FliS
MFANPFQASRAYASTALESMIADASPARLTLMLHDGLLEAIHRARLGMLSGDMAGKGEAVGKALAILGDGLAPTLDRERGGDIAANLGALYEYMVARLSLASLRNDVEALDAVGTLVRELREGWSELCARESEQASERALAARAAATGARLGAV